MASLTQHQDVEIFLDKLKKYLNDEIVHSEARKYISETALMKYIVPKVHAFLVNSEGHSSVDAKSALLAEGYHTSELREFASGTPFGKKKYPFKKGIAAALKGARKEWWEEGHGLHDACPDFALRAPNKHRIVFEGKLFRKDKEDAAKTALVNGVYECSFYRGLPTLYGAEGKNASSYDYACLLVYESSVDQSLLKTWDRADEAVKHQCWEALHVYVMVLPAF
jgi:hypothetical protein